MFYDCSSLQTLDVNNWDTGSVKDMGLMFSETYLENDYFFLLRFHLYSFLHLLLHFLLHP